MSKAEEIRPGERPGGRTPPAAGIDVSEHEDPEAMADLLEAVERFEALVEARGGDLMVDDLSSDEPDDPHFVLPAREPREPVQEYIDRIEAAAELIRRHPPIG
jgi:hypothetical protein